MLLLRVAWTFFGAEIVLAFICGLILWYFWSRAGLTLSARFRALAIYVIGCVLCLLLAFSIPL